MVGAILFYIPVPKIGGSLITVSIKYVTKSGPLKKRRESGNLRPLSLTPRESLVSQLREEWKVMS